MMLATYKCGCPPSDKKPPCPPCCESSAVGRIMAKHKSPADYPESICSLRPVASEPKIEKPPPCCPTMPSDSKEFERPHKLRSEIAEKGLPYKEMEVTINDNRLVIRTQKEEVKQQYDPPCDCVEESRPVAMDEIDQPPAAGSRTVTLYPQVKKSEEKVTETVCDQEGTTDKTAKMENPNIFIFKVKKKSNNGDRAFNIDLEFKTPRPWSMKKIAEYEKKLMKPVEKTPAEKTDTKMSIPRKRKKKK
ncbi:uncharacterized protein [Bombus fervidus]|uniref:uncharacterized protein n=1 Tax=Bombus fervidus TaxID=203811 RepID=UPI003AB4D2B4